jgi:putative DNA primase/helicase
MTAQLTKAGYDAAAIKQAKELALLWPKLPGYIIIPWHEAGGQLLTFYGRWRAKDPPRKRDMPAWRKDRDKELMAWQAKSEAEKGEFPWVEPTIPKTIALPGQGTKSVPLYFDRARAAGHTREIIAVEGVFDAALLQVRRDSRVTAYVGAQFTGEQVETLARYGVKTVVIVPDPDGGGVKGARSSVARLREHGTDAYVAQPLPDGLDPDELLIRDGIEGWFAHIKDPVPGAVYEAEQLLGGIPRTGLTSSAVRRHGGLPATPRG